jgi:hypothetical protein
MVQPSAFVRLGTIARFLHPTALTIFWNLQRDLCSAPIAPIDLTSQIALLTDLASVARAAQRTPERESALRWQRTENRSRTTSRRIRRMFTLLAERYERRSILLTSNLVFGQWDRIFRDQMATAAAIDRLVHQAVFLEFDVPSYRTERAKRRSHAGAATEPAR